MNSFLVITDTPNIINRMINYLLIVMYSYDFYANKENRQKISCVLQREGGLQESHVYDVMYSKRRHHLVNVYFLSVNVNGLVLHDLKSKHCMSKPRTLNLILSKGRN